MRDTLNEFERLKKEREKKRKMMNESKRLNWSNDEASNLLRGNFKIPMPKFRRSQSTSNECIYNQSDWTSALCSTIMQISWV